LTYRRICIALLTATALAGDPDAAEPGVAAEAAGPDREPRFDGLGLRSRRVTTGSAEALRFARRSQEMGARDA
jgi:hypothetical protein